MELTLKPRSDSKAQVLTIAHTAQGSSNNPELGELGPELKALADSRPHTDLSCPGLTSQEVIGKKVYFHLSAVSWLPSDSLG